MSSRYRGREHPQWEDAARRGRARPPRGAVPWVLLSLALSASLAACGESHSYVSTAESLESGREGRASVAFELNGRPVKLELYLRLGAGTVLVELYHPDGRRTESFEVEGPGLREIRTEYAKEPGSWGLRLSARGGAIRYWAALHDRKKYQGPDDGARLLVEGRL